MNLQKKKKRLNSLTTVFRKQVVGRDTDLSGLTFKPLGNRRRFLFSLASSQLPEGTLRPGRPAKFAMWGTQWRLISSRCDFCEYFSANSLRSRPTSAWELFRLRCASIILNRGQILRGVKEKHWPPPHLPPRCFPLFTSSFPVAPTAEWEVNGSAAGGQLWDFWPSG